MFESIHQENMNNISERSEEINTTYLWQKKTCFQTPIWSVFQENRNAVPINVCLQTGISYSNNGFQHFQFSEHLERKKSDRLRHFQIQRMRRDGKKMLQYSNLVQISIKFNR